MTISTDKLPGAESTTEEPPERSVDTVSIVVLTKNAGARFSDVLQSVENQRCDAAVETVVVDSGSTDGTVETAAEFGCELHTIDPEDFHHSQTRNLGGEISNGDVIVYLTQDATPRDDRWLHRLVEPIERERADVVYGRQVAYPDAKPVDKFFYSYFYPDEKRRLTEADAVDLRRFYLENVYVSDVSAAMWRDSWEQLQFREDVGMSEDKDFALRALANGFDIVYEPEAAVHHSHDYDLVSNFQRRYEDGRAYAQIATAGDDEFVSEGVKYVIDELRYLLDKGHTHWIPYALAYDFLHFLGFQTGKYHETVRRRR